MKPSDFTKFPSDSVLKKWESERIARNIMIILDRTGNEFRTISFEEYRTERLKDKNFTEAERVHFDRVIKYFKSADTAMLFSSNWEIK